MLRCTAACFLDASLDLRATYCVYVTSKKCERVVQGRIFRHDWTTGSMKRAVGQQTARAYRFFYARKFMIVGVTEHSSVFALLPVQDDRSQSNKGTTNVPCNLSYVIFAPLRWLVDAFIFQLGLRPRSDGAASSASQQPFTPSGTTLSHVGRFKVELRCQPQVA